MKTYCSDLVFFQGQRRIVVEQTEAFFHANLDVDRVGKATQQHHGSCVRYRFPHHIISFLNRSRCNLRCKSAIMLFVKKKTNFFLSVSPVSVTVPMVHVFHHNHTLQNNHTLLLTKSINYERALLGVLDLQIFIGFFFFFFGHINKHNF